MPGDEENSKAAELAILRALCQERLEGSAREETLRLLAGYAFREPLHQVLFEAIHETQPHAAHTLRQQLLARLTAKGFPDVELEAFFAPAAPNAEEARALVLKLVLGAGGAGRQQSN